MDRLNFADPFNLLMSLRFSNETMMIDGKQLSGALSHMDNAVLAFFWDGDTPKLGSVTVTLPDKTSSTLLGDRGEVLSRMVGERLASRFGKLAVISMNVTVGFEAGRVLIELTDRLAEKRND